MTRAHIALLVAAVACGKSSDRSQEARPIQRAEPVAPRSPTGDDIEYTVRFDAPRHYIDVTALYPTGGAAEIELMMAVWTPGSYLVREYARHVEDLRASTPAGEPLTVDKTRKNRWKVTTGGSDRVAVRYRVYAREMSVRTNFVDDRLAIVNGAPTFITLAGEGVHRHDVALELAPTWKRAVTAMPAHPDGAPNHFLAPDYDTLVDSPIVAGDPAIHELDVEGVAHTLATFGDGKAWDAPKSATGVRAVIEACLELWGIVPYEGYVFLNVLPGSPGGSGLEHRDSTLITTGTWSTRKRADYLRWLGLVSHEFFHTWNGKRLRPVELGPFDYENEVYTRSLWVVEGLTSYYDDLLVRRAGLMSQREYLDKLSGSIDELERTAGRKVQPLSLASYDAWIKYYRGDENSPNSSVSYYTKGAVVGFLLDMELRMRSGGRASLDDVMRLAYERYAGDKGYTPAQFRAVVEEIAGGSMAGFWERYVDGTDELDYGPALGYLGLEFKPTPPLKPDDKSEPAGWLGVSVKGGVVSRVHRDGPGHRAGINVGDELIAIDGYRVRDLAARLTRYRPGATITLTVVRRERLTELEATLERKPEPRKLEIASDDLASTGRRRAWLGADSADEDDDEHDLDADE